MNKTKTHMFLREIALPQTKMYQCIAYIRRSDVKKAAGDKWIFFNDGRWTVVVIKHQKKFRIGKSVNEGSQSLPSATNQLFAGLSAAIINLCARECDRH